jgi:hypothetical protein
MKPLKSPGPSSQSTSFYQLTAPNFNINREQFFERFQERTGTLDQQGLLVDKKPPPCAVENFHHTLGFSEIVVAAPRCVE